MANRHDYDLIVLGGGAAGLTVTAGAARLGVKVLLLEREGRLGGDCLHFGCVPSKTLIATAKARHAMSRAEVMGLAPVIAAPVDFAAVAARIETVIAGIQAHDAPERFEALGAEVRFGRARFTDSHTLDLDGRRITAERFVVATGSRAAIPAIPGLVEAGYLTNRELFTLKRLPASLAILGGGPVAVEMGQAFSRLGSRVTIIQRSGHILSAEDPDMTDLLAGHLRAEGLDLRLGATIRGVTVSQTGGKAVTIERDGRSETVQAEAILVAMGRTPNIDELDLDAAGVVTSPKGLVLDARLRTTTPHIFGAGDVTGAHRFTHAAGYEGSVVVAGAVFRLPRKADYRLMPRCVYTDPELAALGMTETQARAAGIACTVVTEPFAANDRARAEGETEGCVKLVLGRRGRPLGVQILGSGAGEMLGEWVAALGGNVSLGRLAGAVHPYPTRIESNKRIAGRLLEAKLFSPTVRRILGLCFGYRGKR